MQCNCLIRAARVMSGFLDACLATILNSEDKRCRIVRVDSTATLSPTVAFNSADEAKGFFNTARRSSASARGVVYKTICIEVGM